MERPWTPRPRPPQRPWRDDRPRRDDRPWRDERPREPIQQLAEDEELVAGRRPVEETFAAGRTAIRLLVVPDRRAALEALVLHATALRIPVVEVEGGSLTSLAGFDGHQGVALVVQPRRWATLEDIAARAAERGQPPLILILDSLEDPQNVGTLMRTAEACGVHGVIYPTRRSAPLTPAAIKASAGATEHLLLYPVDDLAGTMVDLRGRGTRLIGADEGAEMSYRDADLRGPLALVVGSEGQGLSGHVRRRLDGTVRLPMHGRIESLNAAVAGSVLLFEAAAQRGIPESTPTAAAPVAPVSAEPSPDEAPAELQPERDDTSIAVEEPPAKVRRSRARKVVEELAEPDVVATSKPRRLRANRAGETMAMKGPTSDVPPPKPASKPRRTRAKPSESPPVSGAGGPGEGGELLPDGT